MEGTVLEGRWAGRMADRRPVHRPVVRSCLLDQHCDTDHQQEDALRVPRDECVGVGMVAVALELERAVAGQQVVVGVSVGRLTGLEHEHEHVDDEALR